MTEPDFDRMTKDEVIAWFQNTDSLMPVIRSMTAAPTTGAAPEAPMMLVSIRLPVPLVEHLDRLADQAATRRSDIIRDALTRYITACTAPVSRDEAEHALDVLRRIVTNRTTEGHADAA
ncbi:MULTISPECIES: ribbon-helix-helix domain-containing protein [unclassified Micromonospora]|uniref:ribbon-helix-helix domain-containing protein n=1 Tax=unclassified Micromonospora TaxID=2617518 RepID=UPI001046E8FB|nr:MULTISPECIES: ribbon-helix-helix protein, CopG family [unclassified Micromonospora]TDB69756.1 ribbon-helix-helix protein, CopG family [Micromonospora sp. KC721]TDC31797.1 ribbon-helix-helix protein, CopG family [Micromonospora sp. KC213]